MGQGVLRLMAPKDHHVAATLVGAHWRGTFTLTLALALALPLEASLNPIWRHPPLSSATGRPTRRAVAATLA